MRAAKPIDLLVCIHMGELEGNKPVQKKNTAALWFKYFDFPFRIICILHLISALYVTSTAENNKIYQINFNQIMNGRIKSVKKTRQNELDFFSKEKRTVSLIFNLLVQGKCPV